jgi:hypothetical protein
MLRSLCPVLVLTTRGRVTVVPVPAKTMLALKVNPTIEVFQTMGIVLVNPLVVTMFT